VAPAAGLEPATKRL